jgi:hypothetical protein
MRKFIGMSALIACVMLLPITAKAESNSSRLNRDRAEIGRALVEVTAANWQSVLPYYADDIEYHDPIVTIQGLDTMGQFLGRMFFSSPNLVTVIEDESSIGGIYTATWTMFGSFNGQPYTAKGMSILKFRDKESRVYYQRDYYTEGDIMIQITEGGLNTVAEAFRAYYRCSVDPTFICPFP